MSDGRLSFRAARAEPPRGAGTLVALLLVVALGLALLRPQLAESVPAGPIVEVTGDVPLPGLHISPDGSAAGALRAAGAEISAPGSVQQGERLVVEGGSVRRERAQDLVLFGLPIDLNSASAEVLDAIPSVSRDLADRIVRDRQEKGPFREMRDLLEIEGVGPAAVDRLEAFVEISDPGPLDLNTASERSLTRLPGIGPVLAARIVQERARRGAFVSARELAEIEGISPDLAEELSPLVSVGGAP